jgi:hypothetical protein
MAAIVGVVAVAALVAGCGGAVRMAYNNGDIALRYMADDYLDLRDGQEELLKTQLAQFHAWHRRHELPEYAAVALHAADRAQKGVRREDVTWMIGAVRERARVAAGHAVDDALPVVQALGPANFAALEKKFATANDKFVEENLRGDRERITRRHVKQLEERFQEWLGDLRPDQEALIAAYVRANPERNTLARFEDRKRRQQELLALLRGPRDAGWAGRLRDHFVHWERGRTPEQLRLFKEWEERLVQLVVDMDATLSPQQRRHFAARLDRYADDFRALALQGRSAAEARAELPAAAPVR